MNVLWKGFQTDTDTLRPDSFPCSCCCVGVLYPCGVRGQPGLNFKPSLTIDGLFLRALTSRDKQMQLSCIFLEVISRKSQVPTDAFRVIDLNLSWLKVNFLIKPFEFERSEKRG